MVLMVEVDTDVIVCEGSVPSMGFIPSLIFMRHPVRRTRIGTVILVSLILEGL
jgi:ribosomal protein L3